MEGDLARAIGRRVRELRREKGLSQEAFAHELGLHRTYMGGIERGERNLTLTTLEQLAERLGVPATALICDHPDGGHS